MNAATNLPLGSHRIRMTDSAIAHLRAAVAFVTRHPNKALPRSYWRNRICDLLNAGELLPAQAAALAELRAQIDAPADDGSDD